MGLVVAGVVLLYLPQVHIPWLTPLQGTADAGFFNNDLEVFEEVIDLVSEKYVYPPDHKKLFSAAIEAMIKEAGSKELTLSKNPGINTLRYKNRNTQYKLTYNKKHDWEEFQKIYYFTFR